MKKSISIILLFFFLYSNTALAQTPNQEKVDDNGLYIGASLLGTSLTLPDFDLDSESGGGLQLKLGYDFNTNFALFLALDGSSINPEVGDNYALAHFALGGEGRIGSSTSSFRPFLRVSYLGMGIAQNRSSGDITISGAGFGLGGGVYYFMTNNLALELSYTHSWINLSKVEVGSQSADIDENAQTGRLALGISYHF